MNAVQTKKPLSPPIALESLPATPSANDRLRGRPLGGRDSFAGVYMRLRPKLRAACRHYVDAQNVDDLIHDALLIAVQSGPSKLQRGDKAALSWLIGIAKRRAGDYRSGAHRDVPIDVLLAREAGGDLEGRALHEDVTELRAESWASND